MGWCLRSLAGPRDDTVMGEHGGRVRGIGDTGPPPAHTSRASARAAPARDGFPIWVGDDGCEEVRPRRMPKAHLEDRRSSEGGPFGTSRGRGQEPSPRSYFDGLPPRRGLHGRMFHLRQARAGPPPRSYFESLSTSGPTHPHISTGLAPRLILHGRMFHLRQHERPRPGMDSRSGSGMTVMERGKGKVQGNHKRLPLGGAGLGVGFGVEDGVEDGLGGGVRVHGGRLYLLD